MEISGKQFVEQLDSLGYFHITDIGKLTLLKKAIANTYNQHHIITTLYPESESDITLEQPSCYRLYSCDNESLFEADGISDMLSTIRPTFDKLGVPLQWSNDEWNQLDDTLEKHTILINGRKYTAFKGSINDPFAWAMATSNFVEIINDQLQKAGSEERLFPINAGNDGEIIFLTDAMYKMLNKNCSKESSPMDLSIWWKWGTDGERSYVRNVH